MKRKLISSIAVAVLLTGSMTVSAAGLEDIFDARYYADQYPDLYETFGYDEDALYQHFLTYGIEEGRLMNPVLDVVKYREKYEDLDTAFGEDWDAYVEHYFTFGINEKRDNGTDFDLLAYLNAYSDLQAAFGTDYEAVAEHYMTYGINENRVEGSKKTVADRQILAVYEEGDDVCTNAGAVLPDVTDDNTDDAMPDDEIPNDETPDDETPDDTIPDDEQQDVIIDEVIYTYYDDGTVESEKYYEAGVLSQVKYYNLDGTLKKIAKYEYYENGTKRKVTVYTNEGFIDTITEWGEDGISVKLTVYYWNEDIIKQIFEYDSEGNLIRFAVYDKDTGTWGDVITEYQDNKEILSTATYYNSDGSVDYVNVCVWYYDDAGAVDYTESTKYNAQGECLEKVYRYFGGGYLDYIVKKIYDESERLTEEIYYNEYEKVNYSFKYEYDNEGTLIKTTKYDADGNVVTE